MHKVILFRGGMCGDLILPMINKKYLDYNNSGETFIPGYKLLSERLKMKTFVNYSQKEKQKYFNKFQNIYNEYTLSHDTDFCLQIPNNVIQIVCSDYKKIKLFAKRFAKIEKEAIHKIFDSATTNEKNFVQKYYTSLLLWQDSFTFPNQLDIKKIGTDSFVDDVVQKFEIKDISWTVKIYNEWLKYNKEFT